MVSTCSVCGYTNPDGAVFCMSCGSKLQGVQTPSGGWRTQTPQTPPQPQPNVGTPSPSNAPQRTSGPTAPLASYVAQLQAGKHKHMLTDIGFKDNSGTQVMVARRQSLLTLEYEVFDQYGNLIGRIKRQPSLLHNTFDVTGAQGELLGRLERQLLGSVVFQDRFWLEDAGGKRIATATGDAFDTRFTLTSTATGGLLATVKLDFPGGFQENLAAHAVGRYIIDVYSNELSPLMLVAFLASLER